MLGAGCGAAGLMTTPPTWHLVTCEFPPDVGGVSDYACTMAEALADHGCDVHVWCSADPAAPPRGGESRVVVHGIPRAFAPAGLGRLGRELDAMAAPRRLFIQWVPHGYGYKSLNVWFAAWVARRAWLHRDDVHLMVHEPFLAFTGTPRQLVAAAIHRLMFVLASFGATRVWMSTSAWGPKIGPWLFGRIAPRWLPVPAVGGWADAGIAGSRAMRPTAGRVVVGHFGTHSPLVTQILDRTIDLLLQDPRVDLLLIGRDSDRYREACVAARPWADAQVRATGTLPGPALRAQVAACDLILQPYPDGVSARRTSTLAMLAAGAAVVTNAGALTEPFWEGEAGIVLVPSPDPARLAAAVMRLVQDPGERGRVATAGRDLYDRLFRVERSIALLLASATTG